MFVVDVWTLVVPSAVEDVGRQAGRPVGHRGERRPRALGVVVQRRRAPAALAATGTRRAARRAPRWIGAACAPRDATRVRSEPNPCVCHGRASGTSRARRSASREDAHASRRASAHRDAGCWGWLLTRGAGGGWRRHARRRARAARGPAARRTARSSAGSTRCSRMTLRREARPADAALRRADEGAPGGGAQAGRRRLQRDRPGADQQVPARRRRALAAAHPDPVRLRHDPRLPDDLPDPARRRRAASTRTSPQTDHRIGAFESAAVGLKQIYSPMVDVSHEPRWGRISEAVGRGPVPQLRDGGRARAGRAGQRLQRAGQGRHERQALRRLRPARGRAATTTRPTCRTARLWNFYLPPFKAAVDAGADTAMCSFNALNGVPGCANHVHGDRHPQAAMGLRRLHRERLHRRRRAARSARA